MNAYRPDRVVKTLTFIASILYFGGWVAAVLVLIGIPVGRLVAGKGLGNQAFLLTVRVDLTDMPTTLAPTWAPDASRLTLTDVSGLLQLPAEVVPRWVLVTSWIAFAVMATLMLLFLHHLRRLFMRVRDGAPFDAHNAVRLRWLGVLLLVFCMFNSGFTFWMSSVTTSAVLSPNVTITSSLTIEWPVIFVGLVLLALAEIFRRGTALEDEQSLVI
jgi:hypothetical protein